MEFTQHVNFIDCFDLEAADTFYSGVIGLPIAYSQAGYVNFYRVSSSAFLCVCLRKKDADHEAGSKKEKGAIPGFICSTSSDVDRIAKVEITKAAGPGIASDGKVIDAIYNVMCRDPTGYLVEFQCFLDPKWPSLPPPLTCSVDSSTPNARGGKMGAAAGTHDPWAEWCVVVVDVQVDFYNAPVQEAFPALPQNLGGLLGAAR
eukprot:gene12684-33500_t